MTDDNCAFSLRGERHMHCRFCREAYSIADVKAMPEDAPCRKCGKTPADASAAQAADKVEAEREGRLIIGLLRRLLGNDSGVNVEGFLLGPNGEVIDVSQSKERLN